MSARIKSCGALEYFSPNSPAPLLLIRHPFRLCLCPSPRRPPPPSPTTPPLAAQGDKMGHYAARKILQSSPDKLVLPQWCIVCTVASHRPRGGRRRATHSTAHASDIISHVTLIFESSRYVDCIRSASVSASQYSFLPSFLPSISSPSVHPSLLFATRQPACHLSSLRRSSCDSFSSSSSSSSFASRNEQPSYDQEFPAKFDFLRSRILKLWQQRDEPLRNIYFGKLFSREKFRFKI